MKRAKTVLSNGRAQSSVRSVFTQLLPTLLVSSLFAGVGIMHVTSRVMVVKTGYSLSKLEQESRALNREETRLKLELATLRSPARLEKLAREKLSMGPPAPGTVFPVSAASLRKNSVTAPQVGSTQLVQKDKTL